jgi:hypothetical protein
MSRTSLEIVLSAFSQTLSSLGFEPTESGLNQMKKKIVDYIKKGYKHETFGVRIGDLFFKFDNSHNLSPGYITPCDQEHELFLEAIQFCNLYQHYRKIIKLEGDTDYLENFY